MSGFDDWKRLIEQHVEIEPEDPTRWKVILTGTNTAHPLPGSVIYDGLDSVQAAALARLHVIGCLLDSAGEAVYGPSEVTSADFNRMAREVAV